MVDRTKSKKPVTFKNPITGKIQKIKDEEFQFFEEFGVILEDNNQEDVVKGNQVDVIRAFTCPYQFDNPDVCKELTKPLKKAKFTCEVDVEISLAVDQVPEHKHRVVLDIDRNLIPADADLSDYEIDLGSAFCGMFYNVTPKIQVTLSKQELIEDNSVNKYREQVEEEATKLMDRASFEDITTNEVRLDNHKKLFDQMYDYFQQHLVKELERVVNRLAFEIHTLNDRGDEREATLGIILDEESKELRKRLPTLKGRVPIKHQNDFKSERDKFINECLKGIAELSKRKKNLNKTQLAETMFKDLNPLQSLRRKLKNFELSFEEILERYNEQKSS